MELQPRKFSDPNFTANGETRAWVSPVVMETLWFNTGTVCNLTCKNCYIESSPTNDRLAFISPDDVAIYLDEITALGWTPPEIGFTGGEPFANPQMLAILRLCLQRGYRVLLLTNGMQLMWRVREQLLALNQEFGGQLNIRISLDHYTQKIHEEERGEKSWDWAIKGLRWLNDNGFKLSIAGRSLSGESSADYLQGYGRLFTELGLNLDAQQASDLVVFPEMEELREVPEITTACWQILQRDPNEIMCASSRMVVKDKGSLQPRVAACTLLPYEPEFSLGNSLQESWRDVRLNHAYCAQFCVLGGSRCS